MDMGFFSLLNLERKGLEKVRQFVQDQNTQGASEELLSYMRKRTKPVYLDGWENRTIDPNYDTTDADLICKRNILKIDVGDDIDWKMAPIDDPEWSWCLNRHEHFTTLGRAYWYTGNEKYAKEFFTQLVDWIDKNPPLDAEWMISMPIEESQSIFEKSCSWRPLSAGIRMYTAWIPCFLHCLHSKNFTPEILVKMLSSIADHARYLRTFYTHHVFFHWVSPNWGIMESNGLAHVGIMFPEFKESKAWRDRAMSRLEDQIRCNIFPDGMLEELATGYHLTAAFSFLEIAELATRNGYPVSKEYMRKLEKLLEFCMLIMKPHGVYPMLGDADESDVFGQYASYGWYEDLNNCNALIDSNDLRYVLKGGAKMFNRPDMLWVATHGHEGEKPKAGSSVFPISGYMVMRSGWENDDKYLVIDCGPLGEEAQGCGHGHCDSLSIDVSAFGETLIIDPGRYIYTEDPFRYYFKGTASHNTMMVDNEEQSQMRDSWMFDTFANSKIHRTAVSERVDYFDGSHDGYKRLDDPVNHRRRVLFVKPDYWIIQDDLTGKGMHKFDLLYHFGPKAKVSVDSKTLATNIIYKNEVGMLMIPADCENLIANIQEGQEDPPRGWVSYDYAIKEPAPMITYSKKAQAPVDFTFLLQPFKGDAPHINVSRLERSVVRIESDQWIDLVIFGDGQIKYPQNIEHDGEMLYLRLDKNLKPKHCFAVQTSIVKYNEKVVYKSDNKCKMIEKLF